MKGNGAFPTRTEDETIARYRHHLPQLDGGLWLTDGGIETTLLFHEGFDLPHFAAFHLLRDTEGTARLGADYAALRARFPWINVLGGCCGTDHRHVEAICGACLTEA